MKRKYWFSWDRLGSASSSVAQCCKMNAIFIQCRWCNILIPWSIQARTAIRARAFRLQIIIDSYPSLIAADKLEPTGRPDIIDGAKVCSAFQCRNSSCVTTPSHSTQLNLPKQWITFDIAAAVVGHVQLGEQREQHLNPTNRIQCAVYGVRYNGLHVLQSRNYSKCTC